MSDSIASSFISFIASVLSFEINKSLSRQESVSRDSPSVSLYFRPYAGILL